MSSAAIPGERNNATLLARAIERLAFPVVFSLAIGLHALSMARGWDPVATVAGTTFGSMGLIALPYYLETNPVIVRWAKRLIAEVLADHARST